MCGRVNGWVDGMICEWDGVYTSVWMDGRDDMWMGLCMDDNCYAQLDD